MCVLNIFVTNNLYNHVLSVFANYPLIFVVVSRKKIFAGDNDDNDDHDGADGQLVRMVLILTTLGGMLMTLMTLIVMMMMMMVAMVWWYREEGGLW